jgi:HEAT repeat protein
MKKLSMALLAALAVGVAIEYQLNRTPSPQPAVDEPTGIVTQPLIRTSAAELYRTPSAPLIDAPAVHSVIAAGDRRSASLLIDSLVVSDDGKLVRECRGALARMADSALIEEIATRHKRELSGRAKGRLSNLLSRIENAAATDAIVSLASIPDHPLAHSATEGLSWIGNGPAASALIQLYEGAASRERTRLFKLVAELDRAEARPVIESAARGNKEAVSDDTRAAAIRALSNFPDSGTRRLLGSLGADSSPVVRDAARDSLRRIGAPIP